MDLNGKALDEHKKWHGKIEVNSRIPIANKEQLSIAYTPGVAEPCLEIAQQLINIPEKGI